FLRLPAISVRLSGALSHVMFAAGVGQRCAAAAGALLPRAAPGCAAPPARRVPAAAAGLGPCRADRSTAGRRDGTRRGGGPGSGGAWCARRLAADHPAGVSPRVYMVAP